MAFLETGDQLPATVDLSVRLAEVWTQLSDQKDTLQRHRASPVHMNENILMTAK
jgi:hypothetical protein